MSSASKDTSALAAAKAIVFRFLKYRPRSEKEIISKLREKGIESEIITQALEYFRRTNLLNDRLFAHGWVASRLRKPYGLNRIRRELKQKGVSDEIIAGEFTLAQENYDELSAAQALAERRYRLNKGIPKIKAKKRIYDYLVWRGFGFTIAQRAVNQVFSRT